MGHPYRTPPAKPYVPPWWLLIPLAVLVFIIFPIIRQLGLSELRGVFGLPPPPGGDGK